MALLIKEDQFLCISEDMCTNDRQSFKHLCATDYLCEIRMLNFVLLLEFDEATTFLLTLIKNVFAMLLYQCVTFDVNL